MRFGDYLYRDEIYSLQILLSTTKAGPGRTVKKEQEEISPNHVQRLNLISVLCPPYMYKIDSETQTSPERLPKYRRLHAWHTMGSYLSCSKSIVKHFSHKKLKANALPALFCSLLNNTQQLLQRTMASETQ